MIKKIISLSLILFSVSCFAQMFGCPSATPSNSPRFCETFTAAGTCYCSNNLPKRMCTDMNVIYQRMIAMFGSIEKACKFQTETPADVCIEDWNCFLKGGKNPRGQLCSGTGKACV